MARKIYRAGALLLSAALLISLTACRKAETESPAEPSATAAASPEAAANRGYVVTIPESVLKLTGADIPALARKLELDSVSMNDDGSCTVQMTEEERDTVCAALRESLDSQLAALPENGNWPFLDSVTLDAACRTAALQSERSRYNPIRDNAAAQAIYIPALLYTTFAGGDPETYTLHFIVLDRDGKTVLDEFDYPRAEPEASENPEGEPEPADE
ncbi:MAG: hypothetical protein ACI4GO_05745 [Hominenteromicrobium sp.]